MSRSLGAMAAALVLTPPKEPTEFAPEGAVAGCGCGGGGCQSCTPGTFPPGKMPPGVPPPAGGGGAYANPQGGGTPPPNVPVPVPSVPAVPIQIARQTPYGVEVVPANGCADPFTPPVAPYWDMVRDAQYMTMVVGEATIAAQGTTEVVVQPTQGWFDGFYVEIYAVDAADPQTRQRVRVGRFSVGDCPGDCRTISVFSDSFEANQACCNGRPLRSRFGRSADGNELRVNITNINEEGSVLVQVIVRGYCHRGSCAC